MSSKVYIVTQFDSQSYESYNDGIHKVFKSKEGAEEYIKNNTGETVLGPSDGYYVSNTVEEWEVEE